jgi:hypothetical protein
MATHPCLKPFNYLFKSVNSLQNRFIYQERKSNVKDPYQSWPSIVYSYPGFLFRHQLLVNLAMVLTPQTVNTDRWLNRNTASQSWENLTETIKFSPSTRNPQRYQIDLWTEVPARLLERQMPAMTTNLYKDKNRFFILSLKREKDDKVIYMIISFPNSRVLHFNEVWTFSNF